MGRRGKKSIQMQDDRTRAQKRLTNRVVEERCFWKFSVFTKEEKKKRY